VELPRDTIPLEVLGLEPIQQGGRRQLGYVGRVFLPAQPTETAAQSANPVVFDADILKEVEQAPRNLLGLEDFVKSLQVFRRV